MDADQLKKVLEQHAKWLRGSGGGKRANLSRANLSRAYLPGSNLSGANLSWANLSWADLSGADLSRANLSVANLSRAYLPGSNLSGANLSWANLSWADLSGADLSRANLSGANLSGANLSRAKGADLACAMTEILPREGEIFGWKKCLNRKGGYVIVKARVPPSAKRSNGFGRKCRAEFAEVLEVIGGEVGLSIFDGETRYKAGETVKCDKWCEDRWTECGGGIHFFLTREEAEAYEA